MYSTVRMNSITHRYGARVQNNVIYMTINKGNTMNRKRIHFALDNDEAFAFACLLLAIVPRKGAAYINVITQRTVSNGMDCYTSVDCLTLGV